MRAQLVSMLTSLVALPVVLAGQGRWVTPKCDIKPGHHMVNTGVSYLKNAAETRFDDQREKSLRDAERTLVQAVTSGGQDKNPGAWYYLGRYYVVRDDVAGADTAFRKAEALLPACHDDIAFWRRNAMWVPSFNAGVNALNAQNFDSAIVMFRRALVVYDGEPQTYSVLATAFFNAGQHDSAATYFRRAVQATTDPKDSVLRKDAMFNLGNSWYMARQYDSAAAAYADYLRVVPNDPQALARLGDVLTAAGHADSAMAIYRAIVAHADSIDPIALINAGVSIYNAAPPWPDTATMTASCRTERRGGRTLTAVQRRQITVACDSVGRQAMEVRNAAAQSTYQLAAQAFEAGLGKSPQSRDALFNLANTYLALREADKMLTVSQRLVVIDPMSRGALRLLAQAWQIKGLTDSALRYVTIADSLLPVELTVSGFSPGEQSVAISGMVTNYHETGSTPQKIAFEFLDAGGAAVATQSLEVPALDAGGVHPFQLQVTGSGVIAWRYHKE